MEQTIRDTEEEWRSVLQAAEETLHRAERQHALEGLCREFETQKTDARGWVEDRQQLLRSLDSQSATEKKINAAQVCS